MISIKPMVHCYYLGTRVWICICLWMELPEAGIVLRNYSEGWLWAAKCGCWELNSYLLEDQHIFCFYYLLLSWLLVVLGVESRALPSEVSTLLRLRNLSPSLDKISVCLLQLYSHKQYSLVVFSPNSCFYSLTIFNTCTHIYPYNQQKDYVSTHTYPRAMC